MQLGMGPAAAFAGFGLGLQERRRQTEENRQFAYLAQQQNAAILAQMRDTDMRAQALAAQMNIDIRNADLAQQRAFWGIAADWKMAEARNKIDSARNDIERTRAENEARQIEAGIQAGKDAIAEGARRFDIQQGFPTEPGGQPSPLFQQQQALIQEQIAGLQAERERLGLEAAWYAPTAPIGPAAALPLPALRGGQPISRAPGIGIRGMAAPLQGPVTAPQVQPLPPSLMGISPREAYIARQPSELTQFQTPYGETIIRESPSLGEQRTGRGMLSIAQAGRIPSEIELNYQTAILRQAQALYNLYRAQGMTDALALQNIAATLGFQGKVDEAGNVVETPARQLADWLASVQPGQRVGLGGGVYGGAGFAPIEPYTGPPLPIPETGPGTQFPPGMYTPGRGGAQFPRAGPAPPQLGVGTAGGIRVSDQVWDIANRHGALGPNREFDEHNAINNVSFLTAYKAVLNEMPEALAEVQKQMDFPSYYSPQTGLNIPNRIQELKRLGTPPGPAPRTQQPSPYGGRTGMRGR